MKLMKPSNWLRYQYSFYHKDSIANKWRCKRMEWFEEYVWERVLKNNPEKQLRILDVGGELRFWQNISFRYFSQSRITLLNLDEQKIPPQLERNIISVRGDATHMPQYRDNEFDICFSNSVIEHVGNLKKQKKMAKEMQRVGEYGYLQTPNRYFPIEPHFMFPMFQFLPEPAAEFLVMHHHFMCAGKRAETRKEARSIIKGIRLMKKKELAAFFPSADIRKEKVFGLTKSFCVFF